MNETTCINSKVTTYMFFFFKKNNNNTNKSEGLKLEYATLHLTFK